MQIFVEVAITYLKDILIKLNKGCEGKGFLVKGNCQKLVGPKT